jgi:hypothetical protein
MLDAALRYAALGLSIIPTAPNSKKAAGKWKRYQKQPADEQQIRKWFGDGHDYGIAVVLGKASGDLACRDFDETEAYSLWALDHPDLDAKLPTVATSRGWHVYFRVADADLRFVDLPDGEYRGDSGHYCLLPPTRHPDGPIYKWRVPLPDGEIPFVADVRAAGLLPPGDCYTESAEDTGHGYAASTVSSVYQGGTGGERTLPDRIERMIQGCLPTGPGRRNRQVFELARAIRAVPELAGAEVDDLRSIVERWHTRALPYIRTKSFTDTWIDFIHAWPVVKIPKGATMASIMQKALDGPMPKVAEQYEDGPIRRLVALCHQLDREAGGKAFFLSCRMAGELLGVHYVQANRWLFLLDHDKVVKQLNKGDPARRRAAEYQWIEERT